jgi:hypothetical protein
MVASGLATLPPPVLQVFIHDEREQAACRRQS